MSFLQYTAIEDALYDWVAGCSGMVTIWADQDGPRPELPHAMLTMLTGPRGKLGEACHRVVTSADVTIDAVAEDGRAWVRVNGTHYTHDVAALETDTDVRDALEAQISADIAARALPFTVAPLAGDGLTITPTATGSVHDIDAGPISGTTAASVTIAGYDSVIDTEGEKSWLVQVDVFTCDATGPAAAYAVASECLCALECADTRAALRVAGLSSTLTSAVRRLSRTIVDERVESRAAFDVEFSAYARKTTPVTTIDKVAITGTGAKG